MMGHLERIVAEPTMGDKFLFSSGNNPIYSSKEV